MKKLFTTIITLLLCLTLFSGCETKVGNGKSDDIVILFTNDIHATFNENMNISEVAAYKKKMEEKCNYVSLVDCGDAIQGSYLGLISQGEIMINLMNKAGYDIAILGNHEFDFGMDRLDELIDKANYTYLCANVNYFGEGEPHLKKVKPYEIKQYGDKKVAFIGIDTPNAIANSTPANFMEDGKIVYDFTAGNNGDDLVKLLQEKVDEVRKQNVDYVIVLGHIGDSDTSQNLCSSVSLISKTNGIDVFLDAHDHNVFTRYCVKNKDGEDVISASTGTKLVNLGQLVISKDGIISVSNISDLKDVDEETQKYEDELVGECDQGLDVKIATTTGILIYDEEGVRLVRNRETGLGNLVADSIRNAVKSDIAYQNGGGVRDSLKPGDVTYRDALKVLPFGNLICTVEITGQQLLDYLEYTVKDVCKEQKENGVAIGENGSFPNLSGLKITVDTSIPTSVVVDDNDQFVSLGDTRRIVECEVEKDGKYVPIDPNAKYSFACVDYMAKNGGSGAQHVMENCKLLIEDAESDYQAFIRYIVDELHGDLSTYEYEEGRIIIK